jgi:hypothetical protein
VRGEIIIEYQEDFRLLLSLLCFIIKKIQLTLLRII